MRFGTKFPGPLIPFGAAVDYKPSSEQDKRRLHEFGPSVLAGIFMGYSQQNGGGWSNDLLILDQEDISEAESVKDVYLKRIPASQVNVMKVQDKYRFPLLTGELRQPDNQPLRPINPLSEDDLASGGRKLSQASASDEDDTDGEEFARECEKLEAEISKEDLDPNGRPETIAD